MILTYILTFNAAENHLTEEWVRETLIGYSESDVIDEIIRGDCPCPFWRVYRIEGTECREVSLEIAEKVYRHSWENSISRAAEIWLDLMGFEIQEAAE